MSDEPKKPPRSRRLWIWWIAASLGLYVLSIGPATGFYGGTVAPWPRMAYEAFYAPLFWVCEHVPLCGRAVEGYINLWWRLCWKEGAPFNPHKGPY
jgi:hypothetical protein